MKLTKPILENLIINEIKKINEKSGTSSISGPDLKNRLNKAKSKQTAHSDTEPVKQSLGLDLTRWTHPYSGVTTTLVGKATQPTLGWADTPTGRGSTTYGQGSLGDYRVAPSRGYSRGPSAATTNPSVATENPKWTGWDTTRQDYQQDIEDAESEFKKSSSGEIYKGLAAPPRVKTGPSMGAMKGASFANGKSAGKAGKGKTDKKSGKKKKDESLLKTLGRDFLNEINSLMEYKK